MDYIPTIFTQSVSPSVLIFGVEFAVVFYHLTFLTLLGIVLVWHLFYYYLGKKEGKKLILNIT